MDGKNYPSEMKVLVRNMLTHMYSLETNERDTFVQEVDKTINELQEFTEELILKGEENDK